MEQRELNKEEEAKYFSSSEKFPQVRTDEGTREMGKLYPFLISGGKNTERYYFTHINNTTKYKFNIRPEYFGDESDYTEAFPKRIKKVLNNNDCDVKIFCVFDWDTIYNDKKKLSKHDSFEALFKEKISDGTITICPSMPSIEYWFLLHFKNHTGLLKNYSAVSQLLAPYLKPCFPNSSPKLKKLLKAEKYLSAPEWVINLCAEGKLELAVQRAEENILKAEKENDLENQSYSYVYKIFK